MALLGSAKLMAFLATTNADRTIEFYRGMLGLRLVEDSPFAVVLDANGVMLRVQKVQKVVVPPYTSLGWEVEDISATVRQLQTSGIKFERFSRLQQDELGIWVSPSGARGAWFKDPHGFILSLTQF